MVRRLSSSSSESISPAHCSIIRLKLKNLTCRIESIASHSSKTEKSDPSVIKNRVPFDPFLFCVEKDQQIQIEFFRSKTIFQRIYLSLTPQFTIRMKPCDLSRGTPPFLVL